MGSDRRHLGVCHLPPLGEGYYFFFLKLVLVQYQNSIWKIVPYVSVTHPPSLSIHNTFPVMFFKMTPNATIDGAKFSQSPCNDNTPVVASADHLQARAPPQCGHNLTGAVTNGLCVCLRIKKRHNSRQLVRATLLVTIH